MYFFYYLFIYFLPSISLHTRLRHEISKCHVLGGIDANTLRQHFYFSELIQSFKIQMHRKIRQTFEELNEMG